MEHNEPWEVTTASFLRDVDGIKVTGGQQIATDSPYEGYFDSGYARRIVACVNTCTGIPIETLENKTVLVMISEAIVESRMQSQEALPVRSSHE